MSRRTFEMHQYQVVLAQMRSGKSDRQITKLVLMGLCKCGELRALAQAQGWLLSPLPEQIQLHEKLCEFLRISGHPSSICPPTEPV